MLAAALWAGTGGLALVVGALIGLPERVPIRVIGLLLAFGGGTLLSSIAFELTNEAFLDGGAKPVVVGLALGAFAYHGGNRLIGHLGGSERMDSAGMQAEGRAIAITLGVLLDGIPESVVIGVNQLRIGGSAAGVAFVAAVALSNLPQALGATTGLRRAGHSAGAILGLWLAVAATGVGFAVLAYGTLGGAPPMIVAGIRAFAAGAILVELADVLFPEALERGGSGVGLATALGFAVSFFLTMMA